ncbi:hypothetical protein [Agromyces albus]|uniref:Uncharacterized protein n=1 Tax=Agromyces albus TaxID=205332 RepID=A0A4Q2L2S1_9MICO|nr:hypothetical protein [Agromyces albus]RXZ72415.1 hypothetical protein ESP51_04415 [Agromyces albus]
MGRIFDDSLGRGFDDLFDNGFDDLFDDFLDDGFDDLFDDFLDDLLDLLDLSRLGHLLDEFGRFLQNDLRALVGCGRRSHQGAHTADGES